MSGRCRAPRARAFFLSLLLVPGSPLAAQETGSDPTPWKDNPLLAPERVQALLTGTPACLEGYKPLQSGPLLRLNEGGEPTLDTTFVVEPVHFERKDPAPPPTIAQLKEHLGRDREIDTRQSFPEVIGELKRTYPPRDRQGFTVPA